MKRTYWTEHGNGQPPEAGLDAVAGNIIVEIAPGASSYSVNYGAPTPDSYLLRTLSQKPGACGDRVTFGRLLVAGGRRKDAAPFLLDATCAPKLDDEALLYLARYLEEDGRFEEAEKRFQMAYQLDAGDWEDLVDFLRRRGQPARALNLHRNSGLGLP